jgi:hypothetical protein
LIPIVFGAAIEAPLHDPDSIPHGGRAGSN